MRFLYNLKINGVKHRVLKDDDGATVYDPPLTDTEQCDDDRLQDMLSSRTAPGGMTDDVFLAGFGTLDQQIKNPIHLAHIVKEARKQGYNPRPTDVYSPALARRIGDKAAFLNHGQGLGHAKKVAEERGHALEFDGPIASVKARELESEPKPKQRLHPRIVERLRRRKIRQNPELARANQNELRHEIVEKHGAKEKST